MRQHYSL